MRYLKSFKEAVIIPDKMETGHINSFETLKEYGEKNGFDVVDYDEFYQSLSDEDKKTAPPKIGTPFFALYHLDRKKPMFVLVDKNVIRFMPNFKEIVDDIIGHERVHAGQVARRKGGDYVLPNPNDKKHYFSNKEEIMAFSWTIANDIAKLSKDFDIAVARFKSGRFGFQTNHLWNDIVRSCDKDVVNRYRKMIYQYLEKMFKKVDESVSSRIKNVVLTLSALMSIGLNRAQVLQIKNDRHKMSVVDTILKYNNRPLGINELNNKLKSKIKNQENFIHDYLRILPDKTVVIKPNFIEGLEININRRERVIGVNYRVRL